jgi:hypothetical protein
MPGTGTVDRGNEERCPEKLPIQKGIPSLLMQKCEDLLLILEDQRQALLVLLDDVLVLMNRLLVVDDGLLIFENTFLII